MGPIAASGCPSRCGPSVKALEGRCRRRSGRSARRCRATRATSGPRVVRPREVGDAKMPGDYQELTTFEKLILLRAVRPDRVTFALRVHHRRRWATTTSPAAVRHGRDVQETKRVDAHLLRALPGRRPDAVGRGARQDASTSRRSSATSVNISMGQGQEKPAEATCSSRCRRRRAAGSCSRTCHLMQSVAAHGSSASSRSCRSTRTRTSAASSRPSRRRSRASRTCPSRCCSRASRWRTRRRPTSSRTSAARGPSSRRSASTGAATSRTTSRRASSRSASSTRVMLGRKRSASRAGAASTASTRATSPSAPTCSSRTSTTRRTRRVPWDDLRYIFGEIMYGGHITDFVGPAHEQPARTSRCCFNAELSSRRCSELGPGFKSPDPNAHDYHDYLDYIRTRCRPRRRRVWSPPQRRDRLPDERDECNHLRDHHGDRGRQWRRRWRRRRRASRTSWRTSQTALPENFEMITTNMRAKPLLGRPVDGAVRRVRCRSARA